MGMIITSLRALLVLTLLTGVFYPLAITGIAAVIFPDQATGSIKQVNGKAVGSALIGQDFAAADTYFHSRPSVTTDTDDKGKSFDSPYNAKGSAASNLGPTSADLQKAVNDRAAAFRKENGLTPNAPIPPDMVFASGSGLDPHISPEAARLQAGRVARARTFDTAKTSRLRELVESSVEGRQFGFLGEPRVNVLLLNIALDEMK